jgi:hypothetical protein
MSRIGFSAAAVDIVAHTKTTHAEIPAIENSIFFPGFFFTIQSLL